jgi:hypothetical protein
MKKRSVDDESGESGNEGLQEAEGLMRDHD